VANGYPYWAVSCSPSRDNCQVSAWMQERLLQVLSLGERFHNEGRVGKLKRTRAPPIGEHVGNVIRGEVVEEHVPCRGACPENPPRQYEQERIWAC
jgi:hypothetical protein